MEIFRPHELFATSARTSSAPDSFFSAKLPGRSRIAGRSAGELGRQRHEIELIASENIVSRAVLEAQARCSPTNMPRAIRASAITAAANGSTWSRPWRSSAPRSCSAASFANVQPNSGSQMNQAVFLALLQPGDTFMGLDLDAGGHLTHGSPVNMTGKWFKAVPYGVRKEDQMLDMDEVARMAHEHKPKLIIAGGTAYSRHLGSKRFREIADEVGAYLMVDMAHIAGLVAGGVHPFRSACACRHHHDAQVAARSARRHDPVQRRSAWPRS